MTALTGDFDIDATTSGLPAGSGSDDGQAEAIVQNARDAEDLRLYLRHVEGGETIRSLAREIGCHASTILRRIRRIEARRDDPVIDQALGRAGQANVPGDIASGPRATSTIPRMAPAAACA